MIPQLALFAVWPVVVLVLFQTVTRPVALAVAVIGGYLLLPTQTSFNLPALPSLNKDTVPVLMAAFCLLVGLGQGTSRLPGLPGLLPRSGVGLACMIGLGLAAALTGLTNRDTLVYGTVVLPGLRVYDVAALVLSTAVNALPLLLARKYLAGAAEHRTLLAVLAVAGLIYCLPALYEIRLSPQLNRMVYGFFPHSWQQHIRGGGFRPLVFLHHGLWLGVFFACALLAMAGWMRSRPGDGRRGLFWAGLLLLLATLVLSKTVGALAIAALLLPAALFLGTRAQLLVAALIAGTVLTYPLLRQADLIPVQAVVDAIRPHAPDRAASLQYRINNEDILLAKAGERVLFGWGPWSRSRVYAADTGEDLSTTDGRWIIVMGQGGLLRYLSVFGLFAVPTVLLFLRRNRFGAGPETAALALVMAANLADMIPNGTETPLTWLVAGALLGRIEQRRALAEPTPAVAEHAGTDPAPARPPAAAPAYTRQTTRHVRQDRRKI